MKRKKAKLMLILAIFSATIALTACGQEENETVATGKTDATVNHGKDNETKNAASTTEEPVVEKSLYDRVGGKLYIGDEFTLGTYEQDNDLKNGAEDIEWIVFKYSSTTDSYLCVSKYVLDNRVFNASPYREDNPQYEKFGQPLDPFDSWWQKQGREEYLKWEGDSSRTPYYYHIVNDWETSDIRKWLNDEFYNTAFSDADKENILCFKTSYRAETDVLNCAFGSIEKSKKTTEDYVSMLNSDISSDNVDIRCKATPYAIAQGVYVLKDGTRENEDICEGRYWSMDACAMEGTDYQLSQVMLINGRRQSADEPYGVRPVISIKLKKN